MILDRVPLKPLWTPSRSIVEQSNLKRFQNWLFVKKGLYFRDYHDLWDWSVTDIEDFWECIWSFCDVKTHSLYWNVVVPDPKNWAKTKWFTGATINYAEHIFRHKNTNKPAFLYQNEGEHLREFSWRELEKHVATVATYLRHIGVSKGDSVMGILPNTPETVIAFLAVHSIGAVWSILSPNTDVKTLSERAKVLTPKVVFVHHSVRQLPSLKHGTVTVAVPVSDEAPPWHTTNTWDDLLKIPSPPLEFTYVPFEHPLWVSFSTTVPVFHTTGGILLEHLKLLTIHQNFKDSDRVLWHTPSDTTTWQLSISTLLTGATPVFYQVAGLQKGHLWESIDRNKINHFGCSKAFLEALRTSLPNLKFNSLQSITTYDAPLLAEEFEWVYQYVKKDVWLVGLGIHHYLGSSLVGGSPTLPVFAGEAQCMLLGCKSTAFPDKSQLVTQPWTNDLLAQPLPSIPFAK